MSSLTTKLRLRVVAGLFAATTLLTACTGDNVSLGGSFVFTSPGGKSEFSYPIGERGTVGDFAGPNLNGDGSTIKVSDYRGKVVVVNYWGSWCDPCRAEVDDLEYAYELSEGLNVQFLGVNVQETRESGFDFAEAKKVPYPSISDQGRRTLLAFKGVPAGATPMTFILDREQQVARIYLRQVSVDELAPAIKEVAEEGVTAATAGSSPGSASVSPPPTS